MSSASSDGAKKDVPNAEKHVKRAATPLKWSIQMIVTAFISIVLIRVAHSLSGSTLSTPLPFLWSQVAFIPSFLFAFLRWKSYFSKLEQRTLSSFLRLCLFLDVVGIWASTWIYFIVSILQASLRIVLPGLSLSFCSSPAAHPAFLSSLFCLPLYDMCLCITPSLLVVISLIRSEETLSIYSKRGVLLHFLYDVPAVSLIVLFKALRYPINSLATIIPHQPERILSYPLSNSTKRSAKNERSSTAAVPDSPLGRLSSGAPVDPSDVCVSFIVLGAAPLLPYEFAHLRDLGVKCVINMCREFPFLNSKYREYGMSVFYRPTLDMSAPKEKDIEEAVNFIQEFVQRTHRTSADVLKNRVFIHCKCGMGRSATITLAYLASYGGYTLDDATHLIKEARQDVAMEIKHYQSLNAFLNKFKAKHA